MKGFRAEPIKRDLDKNQTLSCPGNPCLESVIHLLNRVCSRWVSTEGQRGRQERGAGAVALRFQHQSQVRTKKQGCDSFLDLVFPVKGNQQERFLRPDELGEGIRTMAGEAGPQGLNKTQLH